MNVLLGLQWRQEVTWQLEYPLTQTVTPEVTTMIQLAQQDLGGIVPLAMVRKFCHMSLKTWVTDSAKEHVQNIEHVLFTFCSKRWQHDCTVKKYTNTHTGETK